MHRFWESLEKKGRYATLIGLIISLITMGIFTHYVLRDDAFEYLPILLGWGFSLAFLILPSYLKISGKGIDIEVKD